MPFTVYRIEKDQSESIIGYADNWSDAVAVMTADRDNIDYEAGYHWKSEGDENEPEHDDP